MVAEKGKEEEKMVRWGEGGRQAGGERKAEEEKKAFGVGKKRDKGKGHSCPVSSPPSPNPSPIVQSYPSPV